MFFFKLSISEYHGTEEEDSISGFEFWFRYASIQAIESDSHSRNQQCLSYWVMFALYKISEEALGKLFYW